MASTTMMKTGPLRQTSFAGARVQQRALSARAAPRQVTTKAISDTNLVISGATAASLAIGRFVLLPIQRKFNEKAGPPMQNGVPNAEVDRLSEQQTWLLKSNDPANFNIVDVFAWGSIGHALGYFALATASLQVNHVPTF